MPAPRNPKDDLLAGVLRPEINGYQLFELLGVGGQGRVYRAESGAGQCCVVKVFDSYGRSARMRASREARNARAVTHAGVVRVFGEGLTVRGEPYIAMTKISGPSLAQVLRGDAQQRRSPRDLLRDFVQLCSAVEAIHAQNIRHRDIKPANILYDEAWRPVLIDFGLSLSHEDAIHEDEGPEVTMVAQDLGTKRYMSPEVILREDQRHDARRDVYALGVVLYEMLSGGVNPFAGTTGTALDRLIAAGSFRLPSQAFKPEARNADLNTRTDEIVHLAMAKDLELRYQSVSALRQDVERYLGGRRTFAPIYLRRVRLREFQPSSWVIAVGSIIAIILAILVILYFPSNAP